MIPAVRHSATMAVLAAALVLSCSAFAEQAGNGIFPAAAAPDARPPSYGPARGMFLVASRDLVDPNFSESVVLLLEYDAKGALGLIVNRPTKLQLTDLLPDIEELKASCTSEDRSRKTASSC